MSEPDCGVKNPDVHCRMPVCASCRGKRPQPQVQVEAQEDGKVTVTTTHEDGRQDVEVQVTRLDIENRTPEDTQAEAAIISAMSKKIVRVVVLHKPSNEFAQFECPMPRVRANAKAVIHGHQDRSGNIGSPEDYAIIEFDAGQIRVSKLYD